jgi:RNA polymerase I-specific transcription initiation factor RRN3
MGKVRLSSGRLEDCPVVSREVLISRVHMALKYLLRLIPSASGTLAPILSARFPFSEETKKVHMSYINSLIRVIEYAPELKAEIFALITERLVKIDVQMQTDLDDLDDEVAAAIVQAISLQPDRIGEDEDMDDDESDTDTVTSDESLDDDASRIKEVQGNVEKMDAILDTLFSIYNPYFSDPNSALAQNMFDTLLSHFRNIILPTYRSRHTQFLLFHFAQTSEHLVDTFAGECVELAFKSGRAAVLKQSAAAYLASFVARGAHVPPHVVRDVFDYIGTCLDTIRDENEQTCRGPDLQRYGTFYATTQALLYIFCFRWRDLLVSSDDDEVFDEDDPTSLHNLEWHAGVKELLWRTIYSKLNPLKICAPSIVEEFARIAVRLDFMIVYPLLETNKRIRLSQFTLGASGNGVLRESAFMNGKKTDGEEESWHMLDAYFPFDPYQLPVSRRWIASDYVEWKGIPGEDDRDDSTNGEDEEDDGVDLDDEDVDTATDDDEETT